MKKNTLIVLMNLLFCGGLFAWLFLCIVFKDKFLIATGIFVTLMILFIFVWGILFLITKQIQKKQTRDWKKVKRLVLATNIILYFWGWFVFLLSPESFRDLKLEV